MNITKAKEEIRKSAIAYFAKDAAGHSRMRKEEMRPILLMGPPGIGKSAIVKQVAEDLSVGYLSYSMTHHTRQSALGLPHILTREYQGRLCEVTEYTMSEIIASVYALMEESGLSNGILFLDEINCVSETLRPVMLQFLQYKIFGKHELPEGWMVVCAGNPPEYNRSAQDFDVVTLDRLKYIEIEPDFPAWLTYAEANGIHPAIAAFLTSHREAFYSIRTVPGGKAFVTARGWSDLSEMITVMEEEGLSVDGDVCAQYLHMREIAEDFAAYYKLFQKYQSDYRIEEILRGTEPETIRARAQAAPFDERYALLSLLLKSTGQKLSEAVRADALTRKLYAYLAEIRDRLAEAASLKEALGTKIGEIEAYLTRARVAGTMSKRVRETEEGALAFLKQEVKKAENFDDVKGDFRKISEERKQLAAEGSRTLDALFRFTEAVYPEGQELSLCVTGLMARPDCAQFIAVFGNEAYAREAEKILLSEDE